MVHPYSEISSFTKNKVDMYCHRKLEKANCEYIEHILIFKKKTVRYIYG